MDEMADAEMHPVHAVYPERHLSLLWILDKNPASGEVFARR